MWSWLAPKQVEQPQQGQPNGVSSANVGLSKNPYGGSDYRAGLPVTASATSRGRLDNSQPVVKLSERISGFAFGETAHVHGLHAQMH